MFFTTLSEKQKEEYEQAEEAFLQAKKFINGLIKKINAADKHYKKNRVNVFVNRLRFQTEYDYPVGWEDEIFKIKYPEIFQLEQEIIAANRICLITQDALKYQNEKLKLISNFYVKEEKDFAETFFANFLASDRDNTVIKMPNPKSIALLSYLFSLKDDCDHQPIVADSRDSLKKLIEEMLKTNSGTEVAIIYNPVVDGYPGDDGEIYSRGHKTCGKIIRTETGLTVVNIDSVYSSNNKGSNFIAYINAFSNVIDELQQESQESKNDYDINNISIAYKQIVLDMPRQFDEYSCALFAIKDARELNRTIDQPLYGTKKMPLQFLKSLQSSSVYRSIRNDYSEEVDNKGRPLDEVVDKYTKPVIGTDKATQKEITRKQNTYIRHFEEKYIKQIQDYVATHTPEEIYSHIIKYDAAHIDAATLEARWQGRKNQVEKNILTYVENYSENESKLDNRLESRKEQQKSHFKKS